MKLAHEAPHALVATSETAGIDQILPNGHGVAAPRNPDFNRVSVWLAGAGGGTATGRWGGAVGQLRAKVGDHLVGRFCGCLGGADRIDRLRRLQSGIPSLAGFAGSRPHLPGGRNAIPAAVRYAEAVSRRTPVAR
jgi:hypothetical protein